jgi:hypothetical protein
MRENPMTDLDDLGPDERGEVVIILQACRDRLAGGDRVERALATLYAEGITRVMSSESNPDNAVLAGIARATAGHRPLGGFRENE